MARIWMSSPYYTSTFETLCLPNPIYEIILGNIPLAREPSEPEKNWHLDVGNHTGKLATKDRRDEEKIEGLFQ